LDEIVEEYGLWPKVLGGCQIVFWLFIGFGGINRAFVAEGSFRCDEFIMSCRPDYDSDDSDTNLEIRVT
jgi:hypothetical protein